jgi:hypothetical protein
MPVVHQFTPMGSQQKQLQHCHLPYFLLIQKCTKLKYQIKSKIFTKESLRGLHELYTEEELASVEIKITDEEGNLISFAS